MAERTRSFSALRDHRKAIRGQSLGVSIFTQADTLEELKGMVQDAVRCHFEPTAAKGGLGRGGIRPHYKRPRSAER